MRHGILSCLLSRLQVQRHLTLPWYRIRFTGQTWQAVPEPKTSRTRPSSSARRKSFMVILPSTTRNSRCRARRGLVSPGRCPAMDTCLSRLEVGEKDRDPRGGGQTPRERGTETSQCTPAPTSAPDTLAPNTAGPHHALTQVRAMSSRLCLTTPGKMIPSSAGVTSSSAGLGVRDGGVTHTLMHHLPSS